jgi:signal transduction histidine kinase
MNPADETNDATRGFLRITWSHPKGKLRLAGLALTALLGSALIIWVNRTTWLRVERLQSEFETLKPDSFYVGVRMRSDIQRLNDTLLRYRLRGDPADAEAFREDAQNFREWLASGSASAGTAMERRLFEKVSAAYEEYLVESTKVLDASRARWQSMQARDFQDTYTKVQEQSSLLLSLCETFIVAQRVSFDNFLKESNETVTMFQWLLRVSLIVLFTLAAGLIVLFYRGMIAPLRYRLTESQAIIARHEKLASLGALAAGVAHEIRNPLTAIKFRLFSLKKSLPGRGVDNEDAAVIGGEINRLERIVEDFLQFARPSEPEPVDLPAQRILQDVRDLLKPQLDKAAIELKLETSSPNHAWVHADSQQIKQVLINLIRNSADSIGRDGVITLRVRTGSASALKRPADSVVLEVADNGGGIPPDVQKRLFDPFFTTKEGGTGLGLPIASRIIEMHGGELRYETELQRGTTFQVILPRVHDHESQNSPD